MAWGIQPPGMIVCPRQQNLVKLAPDKFAPPPTCGAPKMRLED